MGVDSSYLIDLCKSEDNPYVEDDKTAEIRKIIQLILKGIGLAMGISVAILNIMNQLSVRDSIIMLSWGLATLSLSSYIDFQEKDNDKKIIKKR